MAWFSRVKKIIQFPCDADTIGHRSGWLQFDLATKNTKGHEKGTGALAFDPAKFRQVGFCLPIHTEKIDRITELG